MSAREIHPVQPLAIINFFVTLQTGWKRISQLIRTPFGRDNTNDTVTASRDAVDMSAHLHVCTLCVAPLFSHAIKTSYAREVHANIANKHRTLIVMAKTSRLFNATLSAALVTDVDMKSFRRAKTIAHYANKSNRHSWRVTRLAQRMAGRT